MEASEKSRAVSREERVGAEGRDTEVKATCAVNSLPSPDVTRITFP